MTRTYPCVYQEERTDCGIAALATIFLNYNLAFSLGYLKELAKYSFGENTSFLQLSLVASWLGFNSVGLSVNNIGELKRIELPAIAQIQTGEELFHFVVINKLNSASIIISDPAKGVVSVPIDQFWNVFKKKILKVEEMSVNQKN